MSTTQFGREMAEERIARLIEEARSSAPSRTPGAGSSLRLARALRWLANRIDLAPPTPRTLPRAARAGNLIGDRGRAVPVRVSRPRN